MPPPTEEEELIREAKAASHEAWARIYDAYAQKVYLYAQGSTGNHQAAEDITSTVFLKALKAIPSYRPSQPAVSGLALRRGSPHGS
jgi:RNA polymerase sigma-70 factor, ECF subfamily